MNQKTQAFSISIVIPVFNEQDHLKDCLKSIQKQSITPDEVIVVDNNSTDESVKVVRSFDFVTVLFEQKQGIVYARNKGFNSTKSKIIARIDADTILPKDWVKQVREYTLWHPDNLAVSGPCRFGARHVNRFIFGLHRVVYFWSSRLLFGHNILFGSNMFIANTAWAQVKKDVCLRTDIHEDMDLAVHLHKRGIKVFFEPHLTAVISGRRWASWFGWTHYPVMWVKTRLVH